MGLLRNLIIVALILGLALLALKVVTPLLAWAFQLAVTLILLGVIGLAIIYLYGKLRA
jgi:hypothetical protein